MTSTLLAIDVGNTETAIAVYDMESGSTTSDDGLLEHWRIGTHPDRTTDEFAAIMSGFFDLADRQLVDVRGMIFASGVPRAKASLRDFADRYLDVEPLTIGPGIKTGMAIEYDNPPEVGADRIVNGVAAYELYGGPAIVVDFGTGTNYDIVSARGSFMGGAITPGIEISLDALFDRASALASIELTEPRNVIGKSTAEALQSGTLYGYAASVDGMVDRFRQQLGEEAVVVATGGLADVIAPVASRIDHVDAFLTLHGLRLVYFRNV